MLSPSAHRLLEIDMPVLAYPKSRRLPAAVARKAPPKVAAPSGDLLNAILQYADVLIDMGGGRSLLRLSPQRMADPVIAAPLGREAPRLGEVAILWDDEEDEIFRVLDAARGDHLQLVAAAPTREDAFELTPEALAYIEAHSGK